MSKKVRMSDIGQALGVSTVTVSNALAGKDGVSEAMRQKILKLASEMGYQGKESSRAERGGETVGILVAERFLAQGQSFYLSLYERVLANLSQRNLFGILEPVLWEDEEACTVPRLVQNSRVQALILIGNMDTRYLEMIQQLELPVVQLDAYDARSRLDTVISDGYYGMYRMTDYLIQRGHREIAYLGRIEATSSIADRYFGYCRALQESNISLRPEWVIPDRDEYGTFRFSLPEQMPTAFVCNCDAVAYTLVQMLKEQGYQVPEDVSVVAFDDYLFSNLSSPKITTYAVDMDGMARASVKQLLARWAEPGREREFRVVTGYLRVKDSVRMINRT